jgi:hypothetical protein
MMYPCSPSLQSLPVPGIGFCQTICLDRDAIARPHRRLWPLTPGRRPGSTEQTPPHHGCASLQPPLDWS